MAIEFRVEQTATSTFFGGSYAADILNTRVYRCRLTTPSRMRSPPFADSELYTRFRQQGTVAELGQRPLETDDRDGDGREFVDFAVDGEIWVDSDPGEGSTFSFALPPEGPTND